MKYLKIPEGATSLVVGFAGDMSKPTDEQREAWEQLDEAAKAALAQRLDEEKIMTHEEVKDMIDPGIERAHDQGGPDGADFKEAMTAVNMEDPFEEDAEEAVKLQSLEDATRETSEQALLDQVLKEKRDPFEERTQAAAEIDKALADAVKADHGLTHSLRYTQPEMAEEFERIFKDEILPLWKEGSKEYAHAGHSPFANFERGAKEMGIDRKQVLWVYAMKHKDGIAAALKGHTSQREDVRGRINDFIVYLLLLRGIFNEEAGDSGNFGFGDLEEK